MTYALAGKRVWVAGHRGMVGAAIVRRLAVEDCEVLTVDRAALDLRDGGAVAAWMTDRRPDSVFLAAGIVGGILANDTRPADFLLDNLLIETSIFAGARAAGVEKLLFLGSSCIYPKLAAQPIREDALLTGSLEPTNQWYAIAKIAGVMLGQAMRRQHGLDMISAMPTNLYGPGDDFDLVSSHVMPALIRKVDAAKRDGTPVSVWGTGTPRREFLYVDNCADACVHLMKRYSGEEHVNVGTGEDIAIADLTRLVMEVIGHDGSIEFDRTKPDGTPRKLLDVSRLSALGWHASTPLRDGIARSYRAFQDGDTRYGGAMNDLTLFDSLSRSLRRFEPIEPANVRIYSCGPTVYNYAHLGNLRAYVFTDTLARVIRWKAPEAGWGPLTHVINITDVGHLQSDADAGEDKMETAARASGRDIWAIARHYTDAFKQDLSDLAIVPPTRMPLATDHLDAMIAFAQGIEAKHCYRLETGLYFDTGSVPDYGRLARLVDDRGESRIDAVMGKRHPQDFAIWRASEPGERRQMEWDSPWGRGAPGWHLECSVMSRAYLGARFDIHTGGIDHREIHHPNEIAQNQACGGTADTGANCWMHNNFLVDRTGKMTKSSGDFLRLRAVIDRGHHPLAFRLMCLQAHYRSEMEFSWDGLAAAATRLKRLAQTVEGLRMRADVPGDPAATGAYRERLDQAVSDDLATPRALPVLDDMLADKRLAPADRIAALGDFDAVLGLGLATLGREELRVRPSGATLEEASVRARLVDRREARAAKDFARSDAIRAELADAGVEVMDGDPLGWDWRP